MGTITAVTKTIMAYKPHFHWVFVRKMRSRNRQTDNLVQRPERMPIGAAIELHFKAVEMISKAWAFEEKSPWRYKKL